MLFEEAVNVAMSGNGFWVGDKNDGVFASKVEDDYFVVLWRAGEPVAVWITKDRALAEFLVMQAKLLIMVKNRNVSTPSIM